MKNKKNPLKRNNKNDKMEDIKKSEEKINMLQDLLKNNLLGMGQVNEENNTLNFDINDYKDYKENIEKASNKIDKLDEIFNSFENLVNNIIVKNDFSELKDENIENFCSEKHTIDYFKKKNLKEINDNIKIVENNMKPTVDIKNKSLNQLENIKKINEAYFDQEVEDLINQSFNFRQESYNKILFNKFK